jgi:hypothetical protein
MTHPSRKPKKKEVAPGKGKATSRYGQIKCTNDIAKVVRDLQANGLALKSASGSTQLDTLPKALKHLGPRGMSTYEGVAAGYLRIATRVKELKATWEILTLRESYVGPDGLYHQGVARYVLTGKKRHADHPQACLDLGGAL